MPLASFHLTRYPHDAAFEALSGMGLDRRHLARTWGLRFWRLLGTGRGETMTLGAALRRCALFAVWEDETTLDAFLASPPVPTRWRSLGTESYTVRLDPLSFAGAWGGSDPIQAGWAPDGAPGAPVAILTHATIRVARLVRFYRAIEAPRASSPRWGRRRPWA